MKTIIVYLTILLFFVFTGCKKQDLGSPGKNEIWLEYKAFIPSQMVVPMGTTVTITNKDNDNHTATSTGLFDSGTIKSGNTYTYIFNTKGTFYIFCNFHSSSPMEQTYILVQ